MNAIRAAAAIGVVILLGGGRVIGEDEAVRRETEVQFVVVGTKSGAQTVPFSGWVDELAEGASTTANMQVKFSGPSASSPCGGGVTMTNLPLEGPQGSGPLWRVKAEVRKAGLDDTTIAYEWKRQVDPSASTLGEAEDKGEVVLKEMWPVLLDAVPAVDTSSGCYRNVALVLVAKQPEDPALRERWIGYDLWLVVDSPATHWTRRLQLIGKQGQSVGFDYGMFRSRITGVTLPRSPYPYSDTIETTVTGSVRGRIQRDGSIELRLTAHRAARPSDGRWSKIENGEKRVRAAAGETLRLELPPPAAWDGARDPETFKALAEEHIAIVLTPTPIE